MSYWPDEGRARRGAARATGKRRRLCWLNRLYHLGASPLGLRLVLIALSASGMCAALILCLLGRPYLAVRVLAGVVALGALILLAV